MHSDMPYEVNCRSLVLSTVSILGLHEQTMSYGRVPHFLECCRAFVALVRAVIDRPASIWHDFGRLH